MKCPSFNEVKKLGKVDVRAMIKKANSRLAVGSWQLAVGSWQLAKLKSIAFKEIFAP